MKLPWDYAEAPSDMSKAVPNLPTPEGTELGKHFVRFYEQEAAKQPPTAPRCDECAYRLGTVPNGCGPTLMTALKCIMEGEPFYCHKGANEGEPKRLCAGFEVLSRGRSSGDEGGK